MRFIVDFTWDDVEDPTKMAEYIFSNLDSAGTTPRFVMPDYRVLILAELIKMVHANALAHGFWEGENEENRDAQFLVHLERVHRELGEAGQLHDRFHGIREVWEEPVDDFATGSFMKPEGIPVELADAVIRILDMCGRYGIDLEDVILRKHEYNKTRPIRHGKRG